MKVKVIPVHLLCGAIASAMLMAATALADAQQWPSRSIRVISPFPADANADEFSAVHDPTRRFGVVGFGRRPTVSDKYFRARIPSGIGTL